MAFSEVSCDIDCAGWAFFSHARCACAQYASRFNAWLTQQCSQWTNTMLPALRASDCPEHECVYAFFTHVQKMFNMPNIHRLSLEQLKGAKQTELVVGASYVLQFMQAHVITMQLANRTGRCQWEFVSQQACGDQLMRQMLPKYLRQFLLVAAADEYFWECARTDSPFIMEDVPGHKTFLTLSETTDSAFAALDASTVGKARATVRCAASTVSAAAKQRSWRLLSFALSLTFEPFDVRAGGASTGSCRWRAHGTSAATAGGSLGLSGWGGEASCGGERARLARAHEQDKEWSAGKGPVAHSDP